MKLFTLLIGYYLIFNFNVLHAFPQAKKFIESKYEYILDIDNLVFSNCLDTALYNKYLNDLKFSSTDIHLKRQDLIIVKNYINIVKIIIYNISIESRYKETTTPESIFEAKKIDLYRDYALASAKIQARFERKYVKYKKKKDKRENKKKGKNNSPNYY